MPQNSWDADRYATDFSFVTSHGRGVLDVLAAHPGERVVDLGCGTGDHAAELAARGVDVTGIDASEPMLARARALAPDVRFVLADAVRDAPVVIGCDAVVSNAALHWMVPHEPALAYARACLRDGGRFVAEMGGQGNVRALLDAFHRALAECGMPGLDRVEHWFPSIPEEARLLDRVGFEVTAMSLFERPTPLVEGSTPADWCEHFRSATWARVPASVRDRLHGTINEIATETLLIDGVWTADYRRLRFVAIAH